MPLHPMDPDASAAPEESDPLDPGSDTHPEDYISELGFDDFNLSPPVRRALAERGYIHPTPVQAKVYQPAMEGRDLIVRSKTGTGKTAAFGLPLLEMTPEGEKNVRALVLCPTRELALQVASEISDLGKYKGVAVATIYGGASMKVQQDALEKGSPIVVGTPGRVYDHIRRKTLKLGACRQVVLDEADEMLSQGFYEEVTRILDCLPKDRQVLLFSATVPPDIQNLIGRYTRTPQTFLLSGDVLTVEHIKHVRYDLSDAYPKPRNLIYVLEMEEPENAIIFCNTRDDTSLVTAVLNRNGFDAELLNGELPQRERERVMNKIKRGEVAFMVATDIAARGIDISDLGYVINYSLPEDPAVYLHRVGRTGRIGKKGTALNLVSGRELSTLTTLEKKYGIAFETRTMPSPEEALKLWTDRHVREIREGAAGSVFEGLLPLAGQIRQRTDADDLIAFLLRYFFTHHRMDRLQSARAGEATAMLPSPPMAPAPRRPMPSARERDKSPRERVRRKPVEGERDEKKAKPASESSKEAGALSPARQRLWLSLGSTDGFDNAGLLAGLESLGIAPSKVLKADVRTTYSYLMVAEENVAAFEELNGKAIGGKSIKIERAKKR